MTLLSKVVKDSPLLHSFFIVKDVFTFFLLLLSSCRYIIHTYA